MPITQESHRVAKFKTKQHRELDAAIRDVANIIALVNTNEAAIAANISATPRFTFTFRQTGTSNPVLGTKINTTGKTFTAERVGVGVYRIACTGDTTYFNTGTDFLINGVTNGDDATTANPTYMIMPSELDGSEVRIRVYPIIVGGNSYLYVTTTDNLDVAVEWSTHITSLSRVLSFEYVR